MVTSDIDKMVLSGQDAWRRHPLISGLWKKPLPGLGTAAFLFAGYCAFDYMLDSAMKPLPNPPKTGKFRFQEAGDVGDTMPEGGKRRGGH